MDQKQMCKQMIDLNKMAFDNTFNAMTMFQEQIEKMATAVLQQNAWLPEDGKRAIEELVRSYKKGREDFKKIVDESFKRVEVYFAGPGSV